MERLAARFSPGTSEEILVHVRRRKGRAEVDIRVYAMSPTLKDKLPTGRGLSIPAAFLPEFKNAIQKAETLLNETKDGFHE